MTEEERAAVRRETFDEITTFLRASGRPGVAGYLEYTLLSSEDRVALWERK